MNQFTTADRPTPARCSPTRSTRRPDDDAVADQRGHRPILVGAGPVGADPHQGRLRRRLHARRRPVHRAVREPDPGPRRQRREGVTNIVTWSGLDSSTEPQPTAATRSPRRRLARRRAPRQLRDELRVRGRLLAGEPQAWSILTYGQTGDRESPLFEQQTVRFSEKNWRRSRSPTNRSRPTPSSPRRSCRATDQSKNPNTSTRNWCRRELTGLSARNVSDPTGRAVSVRARPRLARPRALRLVTSGAGRGERSDEPPSAGRGEREVLDDRRRAVRNRPGLRVLGAAWASGPNGRSVAGVDLAGRVDEVEPPRRAPGPSRR